MGRLANGFRGGKTVQPLHAPRPERDGAIQVTDDRLGTVQCLQARSHIHGLPNHFGARIYGKLRRETSLG